MPFTQTEQAINGCGTGVTWENAGTMSDRDSSLSEAGPATAAAAEKDVGDPEDVEYVRRSFYLPRPLVERLEEQAREAGGDSSRILAVALAEHLGGNAASPSSGAAWATAGPDEAGSEEAPERGPEPPGPAADAAEVAEPTPGPDAAMGAEDAATPDATAPPAEDAGGDVTASTMPAEPEEDLAPPDFSDDSLTAEAHDLAESLYSRLSLLGTAPLDSQPVRDTLRSVSRVIEERDAFTGGHAAGVAGLARGVAETMGLPPREVLAIELAGLAHELGKLAVPLSILSKQGRLTASERETMRRYPKVAARLMRSVPTLRPLEPIVMHHQERWDGSGYPAGLAGEEIPVGAQIVGIADAYHALTSARSYRPALDSEQARNVIREASGRLWNPRVASALIQYAKSRD